ncbi:MAG: hypothetical protein WBD27_15235 [Pyrinomonadaceae bacterium]
MKAILTGFVVVFVSLVISGCNSTEPKKAKGQQLLKEIKEISQKAFDNMGSEDIMPTMMKLNERKKNFPDGRDEIEQDAEIVQKFFGRRIGEDIDIVTKFEGLLALGLVQPEADCITSCINLHKVMIERSELVRQELDLLFDENIEDKGTLESRSRAVRKKQSDANKRASQMETEKARKCSKAMLGIE